MAKKNRIGRMAGALAAAALFLLATPVAAWAQELVPVGRAVGIEMSCDGILVAGLAKVSTAQGEATPAADAGILPGDIILSLCGVELQSAEDFLAVAAKLDGSPASVLLRRGEKLIQYQVAPALTGDGGYKLGILLRDGISGIGTVTFYDPETGLYGALGHAINDTDTGVLLPLRDGRITPASVADVKKGVCGAPGELHGAFDTARQLGSIVRNSVCGIFGFSDAPMGGEPVEVASAEQVKTGRAVILAQVSGTETREYDVEISRVYRGGEDRLMVTVTDPALLALTGGIVQGMSGCPILQEGRLVGAVTHVLLSDPTRGYGVLMDSMLAAADGCAPSKNAA